MNLDAIFPLICGYEDRGDHFRLYVEGPAPEPSFTRECGVKTPLFRLFGGADAQAVRAWLARNRAWQCLRVPVYTRERGVRAVLLAADWHAGEGSALYALARDRAITDEDHRRQLRREVGHLIRMVLENPVRDGELERLQVIEDVANAGPVGVELATTAEVVDTYFAGG